MGHTHDHLFLNRTNLRVVFLEHQFKAHVVRTQHVDVIVHAGFVFDSEHVDFFGTRKRKLAKQNLVVFSVLLKLLFYSLVALFQFLVPGNQQMVQFGIVGGGVVNTAIFQVREGLVGHRVTTEELVFRRNEKVTVGVLGFENLRNNIFHVVAFDSKANIQERKLVEHVHRGHDQGVGFDHA